MSQATRPPKRFLVLSKPRCGSTALAQTLRCQPQIHMNGELLGDDFSSEWKQYTNIFGFLNCKLCPEDGLAVSASGFKLFPEHLKQHGIKLKDLVDQLDVRYIFILWRSKTFDRVISEMVALESGSWYRGKEETLFQEDRPNISLDENVFKEFILRDEKDWHDVLQDWPFGVTPSFVSYERLFIDHRDIIQTQVLDFLGISFEGWETHFSGKQYNKPYSEIVKNFSSLDNFANTMKNEINLPKLFAEILQENFGLRGDAFNLLPDKEPSLPTFLHTWTTRVGAPFLPKEAKAKVIEALETGMVSSASSYVSDLKQILCKKFSAEVAQPCCNGFAALVLALQASNIGPGDDVIVPSMTMVAVGNAVHFLGANPIFVDNSPENRYNPSWKEIEEVSTEKVKAVIVCHTYGVPVPDLVHIKLQCKRRNWILIEDLSEAVGVTDAQGVLLGTVGDFVAASLYANKIVHAADGGFVLARTSYHGHRLESLVNHGFTKGFHFVHFENAINAKMNGLGAALACGTIPKVDEVINQRSKMAGIYRKCLERFAGLHYTLMPKAGLYDSPWVFGLECKSKKIRTLLRAELAWHGVETRDFFFPQHLQPAFNKNKTQPRLEVSERVGSTGLYLPIHTAVSVRSIENISQIIIKFFSQENFEAVEITSGNEFTAIQCSDELMVARVIKKVDLQFAEYILHETTSLKLILMEDLNWLILKGENTFLHRTMMAYLQSQTKEWLPCSEPYPWLDINIGEFQLSQNIFSTSSRELCQVLAWCMFEFKPKRILEVGTLFGYSAMLMYETNKALEHITCVDPFKWYKWMGEFVESKQDKQTGSVIFEDFLKKVPHDLKEKMRCLKANIGEDILKEADAEHLENTKFDFVFLDFTKQTKEFRSAWRYIEPTLVPGKTILLINEVTTESIEFFTEISELLEPIAKPATKSKVYRYLGKIKPLLQENLGAGEENETFECIPRRLKIEHNPGWSHHHQNAFGQAILRLKDRFHDDHAKVLFIPAVEQYFCDAEDVISQPWIGIIHNVVSYPQLYYVPDLARLCTENKYGEWFKKCKGLFTLTETQAAYLRSNLHQNIGFKIPIQVLKYPIVPQLSTDLKYEPKLGDSANNDKLDVVFIGNFLRDFDYFYKVKLPESFNKCLLIGEEDMEKEEANAKKHNIRVLPRASTEEYEKLLQSSVVFLSLTMEGAAHTLLVECISRNVPIVAPNMGSVTEYIGTGYPLLYKPGQKDLSEIMTKENIELAAAYLTKMDKSVLSLDNFVRTVEESSIIRYIPSHIIDKEFDVTIAICQYRRSHHLPTILEKLWNNQTYQGRIQIIVWNNNHDRSGFVEQICHPYIRRNGKNKNLELIQTSENHYCAIRLSLPPLIKSKRILVCDDDIIPGKNFVSFFMEANKKHENDVLCLRGHYFLHHVLQDQRPEEEWISYENLRFADDHTPERLIHYVHSDVCLFTKETLMEVASEPMPDDDFDLVDDYWISYVANRKFGHSLRKLSSQGVPDLIVRTSDSDTKGLALHTRPETIDAKLRMYIHHMLQGWPKLVNLRNCKDSISSKVRKIKTEKVNEFKKGSYIGFNISSEITDEEIKTLVSDMKVKTVRVGAVASRNPSPLFEFHWLLKMSDEAKYVLQDFLKRLERHGLSVILTLDDRIASPEVWQFVANICNKFPCVIGYDLINEPRTKSDLECHHLDVSDEGLGDDVIVRYQHMIRAVRDVDDITAIIIEPSFYGQACALDFFPVRSIASEDPQSNVIVSVHFYEPRVLTWSHLYRSRWDIGFPGQLPMYPLSNDQTTELWDYEKLISRIKTITDWADKNNVPIFLGEVGIGRNTRGAADYLQTVFKACKDVGMGSIVYAFRDKDWDNMDYELGTQPFGDFMGRDLTNPLIKTIKDAISAFV